MTAAPKVARDDGINVLMFELNNHIRVKFGGGNYVINNEFIKLFFRWKEFLVRAPLIKFILLICFLSFF